MRIHYSLLRTKFAKKKCKGRMDCKFEGWPDKYNQLVSEQEIKNY